MRARLPWSKPATGLRVALYQNVARFAGQGNIGTGTVYVPEMGMPRLLLFASGARWREIGLPHNCYPSGVGVDSADNIYLTCPGERSVWKLAKNTTVPIELPITGLIFPVGIAVDPAGSIYVADNAHVADNSERGRVVKLARLC